MLVSFSSDLCENAFNCWQNSEEGKLGLWTDHCCCVCELTTVVKNGIKHPNFTIHCQHMYEMKLPGVFLCFQEGLGCSHYGGWKICEKHCKIYQEYVFKTRICYFIHLHICVFKYSRRFIITFLCSPKNFGGAYSRRLVCPSVHPYVPFVSGP